MHRALWLALLLLAACRGAPVPPAATAALAFPPRAALRLVLVGDTGAAGPERDAVLAAISREPKDYVVVLGDLAYPWAPKCRSGRVDAGARSALDEHLGPLARLGAPALLLLGNHDVAFRRRDVRRESCFLDYARGHKTLVFPALSYSVDLGVALLIFLNTNDLTEEDGARVRAETTRHRGWRILFGHHGLRTYHDKEREDRVRRWLRAHGIRPHFYANGHAHLLQFGVYEGVPALTSGSGAKLRRRPSCPPRCGPGQLYGESVFGYATLHVRENGLEVAFKDRAGAVRWRWSLRRMEVPGAPAPALGAPW
jgi:3',5'-cyclic AMP phosphodiesterase CpdA